MSYRYPTKSILGTALIHSLVASLCLLTRIFLHVCCNRIVGPTYSWIQDSSLESAFFRGTPAVGFVAQSTSRNSCGYIEESRIHGFAFTEVDMKILHLKSQRRIAIVAIETSKQSFDLVLQRTIHYTPGLALAATRNITLT